ncbi:1,4-beta-D-glucan glucohydrolase [Aquincola sp. S2]|uniref:1,4-beta-D-glucan glucohydrolase n=1 Tax=Pseudaquabacterium terrae TaxID=2732868 RepID=A0ABX2EST3_9BURK|nr:GDSL-type esterase/lipase family protein [Aquabacterium terrae]NRF71697.1 1,4-beta-D-glucan glucohydrolase [Aquabacterium terrae]
MTRTSALVSASFIAWAGAATAQPATDLVLLPAPANAWRTVVGHWEHRVELAGGGVGHWETRPELAGVSAVVPQPTGAGAAQAYVGGSALGPEGARTALSLEWKDVWMSTLRLESRTPLDLRPYAGGALTMDLHVDELAQGGLRVKVACGESCERSVSLLEPARAIAGKGWQRVSLPLSCFQREGGDFSRVSLPFALEGGGRGRVSVANLRLTRAAAPATLNCADYRTESVTPAMLAESWSLDWWRPRHEQKRQEARERIGAGQPPQLVFIGDSITQGWENEGREVWAAHFARYHALNLGFGGDRTENVLWRLQNGALDGLAPKTVVLMIGTNNTGHRAENPETTAAGIRRLLDEIRQRLPQSQVLLLAVFPREEQPSGHLRRINDRVNELIGRFADGRHVHFANLNTVFTQPDGTLSRAVMPDLLHLSPHGYALWHHAMAPVLSPLLNRP